MKKSQNYGWPVILALSFFPALLWAISPYSIKSVASLDIFLLSVGQVTALVGTAMFALTLFLSARLATFEKIFKGMNDVYERHSKLGQLALILLLFHPMSLLPSYTSSIATAAGFLLPSSNWALNWGIFSLGSMLLLIVLTLYLRPRYNIWKWTHKLLGLAFFMGALHGWMISSTVSSDMVLRTYLFTIVAAGLLAYTYRTLLGFFLVKQHLYRVESVTPVGQDIVSIRMKPVSQAMPYEAGQFVFIRFNAAKISGEVHPFSISSAPADPYLEITVKNLGDYTSTLTQLPVGATAKIEGPYGVFSFRNKNSKKQIWIAGGIGVTPFLGMARSLTASDDYQIDLYYCVQDEAEAVYDAELKSISDKLNGKLKLIEHPSKTCGRINADLIEKQSAGLNDKDILLCAPPAMIRALRTQFATKNLTNKQIHSEEFSF